jgi:hypothetical protein
LNYLFKFQIPQLFELFILNFKSSVISYMNSSQTRTDNEKYAQALQGAAAGQQSVDEATGRIHDAAQQKIDTFNTTMQSIVEPVGAEILKDPAGKLVKSAAKKILGTGKKIVKNVVSDVQDGVNPATRLADTAKTTLEDAKATVRDTVSGVKKFGKGALKIVNKGREGARTAIKSAEQRIADLKASGEKQAQDLVDSAKSAAKSTVDSAKAQVAKQPARTLESQNELLNEGQTASNQLDDTQLQALKEAQQTKSDLQASDDASKLDFENKFKDADFKNKLKAYQDKSDTTPDKPADYDNDSNIKPTSADDVGADLNVGSEAKSVTMNGKTMDADSYLNDLTDRIASGDVGMDDGAGLHNFMKSYLKGTDADPINFSDSGAPMRDAMNSRNAVVGDANNLDLPKTDALGGQADSFAAGAQTTQIQPTPQADPSSQVAPTDQADPSSQAAPKTDTDALGGTDTPAPPPPKPTAPPKPTPKTKPNVDEDGNLLDELPEEEILAGGGPEDIFADVIAGLTGLGTLIAGAVGGKKAAPTPVVRAINPSTQFGV